MVSAASPKATPPRAGTSRLLSMKFMNRLGPGGGGHSSPVASSPLASPALAAASPAYRAAESEDEEDGRSAKRRRVSGASTAAAADGLAASMAAMQAAVDEEERRRQAAIKKRAADFGDEQWTWDRPLPAPIAAKMAAASTAKTRVAAYGPIVRVGFAEIDSVADAPQPAIMRFNMKQTDTSADSDHEKGADSQLTSLGGSRKRARSEAGGPRKKDGPTKLKHLTSLSSQGGQNALKCHRCGRAGHKSANCPSSNPRRPNASKKR